VCTKTADEVSARCNLYGLAARLLAGEVDLPLYRWLTWHEVAANFGSVGLTLVDRDVRGLGEREAVRVMSIEFCRLFVGPHPVCPPYASAWLGDVLLGGRAAARLEAFLARHGLAMSRPEGSPVLSPDHLAMELTLLCKLYEPGASASPLELTDDARARAARELVGEHLVGWAVPYLRDLEAQARISPYRSIAQLTAVLLASES
jgi:TorA maturation chaperone TorD